MSLDRRAAWEPVGIDISGATTIEEALQQAELDFQVVKNPIFNATGESIPNYFATTRTDDGTVLGIVGNRYKIIQNKDAFDFTNNLVEEGVVFEKAGVWHKGSAMWVQAKLPEQYTILGDEVDAHVVFVNSHDGKGSVKVLMVPNRLFCSNQLNLAIKGADRSWSAVHSSQIDSKLMAATETLGLAEKYMVELENEAQRLASTKMTDDQFDTIITRLYPITDDLSQRKIVTIEEIRDGLHNCLHADDNWEYKDTAYGKIMAVTDFFDHKVAGRLTAGYADNLWENVAQGHAMVDQFYKEIKLVA